MKKGDNSILLENFLEMLSAERGVAQNTLLAYNTDLIDFFSFLSSIGRTIELCQHSDLISYIVHLTNRGLNGRTVSRKISALKQFFQFLVLEKSIVDNPAAGLEQPKKELDLPKALSKEDVLRLIESAYQDSSPNGVRLATMLEILYSSGLRISELVTLKMASLQKNLITHEIENHIIVKGKGGKERLVLLNDNAINILHRYLLIRYTFIGDGSRVNWLFPSMKKNGQVSHLTRQRFGQLLKELGVSVGIDRKKLSPHKIRHSFASHMLENGANLRVIQELLGHSDISSTQIYTKVLGTDAQRLVLSKHPIAR